MTRKDSWWAAAFRDGTYCCVEAETYLEACAKASVQAREPRGGRTTQAVRVTRVGAAR